MHRLYAQWRLVKQNYEQHLHHYAASPLHRVVLMPPPRTALANPASTKMQLEIEQEQQDQLEAFIPQFAAFTEQSKGVHPVIEHTVLASKVSDDSKPKKSQQADVLIARLRNGKIPTFLYDSVVKNASQTKIKSPKQKR